MDQFVRFYRETLVSHRWLVWAGAGSVVLCAGLVAFLVVTSTPAYACDAGGGGGSNSNWNWNMNFNSNDNYDSNSNFNSNSNSNSNSNTVELRG